MKTGLRDPDSPRELRVVYKKGKHKKGEPRQGNGGDEVYDDMVLFIVTDFMGQDRNDLFLFQVFDQRIEKGDPLFAPEPGEIGIGLGRPFGAVDHEDVL